MSHCIIRSTVVTGKTAGNRCTTCLHRHKKTQGSRQASDAAQLGGGLGGRGEELKKKRRNRCKRARWGTAGAPSYNAAAGCECVWRGGNRGVSFYFHCCRCKALSAPGERDARCKAHLAASAEGGTKNMGVLWATSGFVWGVVNSGGGRVCMQACVHTAHVRVHFTVFAGRAYEGGWVGGWALRPWHPRRSCTRSGRSSSCCSRTLQGRARGRKNRKRDGFQGGRRCGKHSRRCNCLYDTQRSSWFALALYASRTRTEDQHISGPVSANRWLTHRCHTTRRA